MNTFHLFASLQSAKSQRRVRWLALGLAALLLYLCLFGLTSPALGAQKHGCAPDTPPPVSSPVPAQAIPGLVLINEALSQPKTNWNCSEPPDVFSQAEDSWIELYNPQSQAIDLYAAHAQISLDGGSTSINLPLGSAINAQSFLVIFPQEKQTTASPIPWNIVLSIQGTTIDQAAIPLLQPDQSYARVPDGSTTWLDAGNPTIDASNNSTDQPVTPTPTKTPKPTPTPKLTPTPKTTSTSGGSGANQPTSSGTQPAWGQVLFPPDSTPTPGITTTADPATQLLSQPQGLSPPQSSAPNGWLIALIIFCALLLLAVLIWYWRLFRTP